ncbi:MAG: DUF1289 domain-containing protein [Terriglobales bacterium]
MTPSPDPGPASPCNGICRIDDLYCVGCGRTGEEIGAWMFLSATERQRLMVEVLPQRRAALAAVRE